MTRLLHNCIVNSQDGYCVCVACQSGIMPGHCCCLRHEREQQQPRQSFTVQRNINKLTRKVARPTHDP